MKRYPLHATVGKLNIRSIKRRLPSNQKPHVADELSKTIKLFSFAQIMMLMQPLFSKSVYTILFALLCLVYIIGLFVPLMNNDAAHHADIALHMHLTGDYISLIDKSMPYLDKPHLLFWLAAFSYKLFGVTSFAYRFPSFLFTIVGTYSVYRLGKSLYNQEIGKLAALIIASASAYILANTDVRMDAILTACIAFATWQLVDFVRTNRNINLIGAAAGLALGFCTKGHIAVFVPAVAILFYILYLQKWKLFVSYKWLLLILFFGIFIAPVVYCYYVQYNLHPEVMVRGKDHINGVLFILWQQSIDRFSGEMGSESKTDYLFFIHSFLWAFAPWSIVAFIAFISRLSTFHRRSKEWLTTGTFLIMLIMITLSEFKLPHYLNITFPIAAVMTASFIIEKMSNVRWIKNVFILQCCIAAVLLLLSIVINGWAFPVHSFVVAIVAIALLAAGIYCITAKRFSLTQKTILTSFLFILFAFFLLNSNFYPSLLTYQGGSQLAFATTGKVNPDEVYLWKDANIYSWNFYTSSFIQPFTDSVFTPSAEIWILSSENDLAAIQNSGYKIGKQYSTPDYRVSLLKLSFINPATREKVSSKMVLSQITGKE